MDPVIRTFVQHCFAAVLLNPFELEVNPENVVVTPKGKNGEYDCRFNDAEISIATGSFLGYASYGAVCITRIYDPEDDCWDFPHTWRRFSTATLRQPTGWPAVAE